METNAKIVRVIDVPGGEALLREIYIDSTFFIRNTRYLYYMHYNDLAAFFRGYDTCNEFFEHALPIFTHAVPVPVIFDAFIPASLQTKWLKAGIHPNKKS